VPGFSVRLLTFICVAVPYALSTQNVVAQDNQPQPRQISFDRDVRPILIARCVDCHGATEPEGGLNLLSRDAILRGGESGEPAAVPGRGTASRLLLAVSGADPDLKMPPDGERLSAAEIAILRTWIDQGLELPATDVTDETAERLRHWSFQPVRRPPVPVIRDAPSAAVVSPVDAFIAEKLTEAGLDWSPRADRTTLIRRLYLVMLGLPPTPDEIEHFLHDPASEDQAWLSLVDRVLASPRYGERWARHWLDIIRFGETHGFETNRERPHAWRFRDWVIDAFNNDKPYDRFILEQLAGDAIDSTIATGFLVAGPHDVVKSPDINLTLMQRQDELADLINTTGTAFLGMTLGCARCHSHKFDPVSQQDFYAIQAVFAGVQHGDRALPLEPAQIAQLADVDRRIKQLRRNLEPFLPPPGTAVREAVTAKHNIERFTAVDAQFIRFTIQSTSSGSQPCLDEIEVFSGERNVALASAGTKATCSSSLPGHDIHRLEHVHDGRYGNGRSWISNEPGTGWVQLELPEAASIDRIEWARDREGKFGDRVPVQYHIEAALKPGAWRTIASSEDRKPFGTESAEPAYHFEGFPETRSAQGRSWLSELNAARSQRDELARPPSAYAGTFQQPGPTHRLYRGDPAAPREEVTPDAIAVLGSLHLDRTAPERERRLRFAGWVASADNPLTSRVIVNRLWQFQFGTGLVDTPSDFGRNGTPPTHPQLLDWLASELISSGWSLKHMQRVILTSRAWQQDSRPRSDASRADAASRLLWRFPPRRLEAEAIRDSLLAVSGVLDTTMGGPGFSGFEVDLENVRHYHPKTSFGPADWRRMIYMTKVRQEQDAVFGALDCPDASQVMPVRSRSTTPLQALNLLNSNFVLQQAELLAVRLEREAGPDLDSQVSRAFTLCFGRPATAQETASASAFAEQHGTPLLCRALLNSNEFLFVP